MKEGYTLITGASKGIGLELTKIFAKNHHNLILVARSKLRWFLAKISYCKTEY